MSNIGEIAARGIFKRFVTHTALGALTIATGGLTGPLHVLVEKANALDDANELRKLAVDAAELASNANEVAKDVVDIAT